MTNLYKAVAQEIRDNVEGMSYEEAHYWVENDAICEAGSVAGLIYYHETEAFFDKYEDEILDLARDCAFELSPTEIGMTGYKNTMAWFAFEALKDTVFENEVSNDYESEAANA